jgi:hypothetical protein
MPFNNILKNPNLSGKTAMGQRKPIGYEAMTVEWPDDWELIAYVKHDDNDPEKLPGSVQRANGYAITLQHWKWEGGYLQRGVTLKQGQRYLCKAVFQLDFDIANVDADENWRTAVEWQFVLHVDGYPYRSAWMHTDRASGKERKIEEALWVIEAEEDLECAYQFLARSYWGNVLGDLTHFALTLEEVPSDYGTPTLIRRPDAAQG